MRDIHQPIHITLFLWLISSGNVYKIRHGILDAVNGCCIPMREVIDRRHFYRLMNGVTGIYRVAIKESNSRLCEDL